jgi:predicted nucleotidyltransferase component of viral defense system
MKKPVDLGKSVHARLLNLARARGEEFQITLRNYFFERFLYRLQESKLSERFVLKGAMLFRIWAEQPYRATMDLDLLSRGDNSADAVKKDIAAVCATKVLADGVVFDTSSITAEPIRAEEEYSGIRTTFTGALNTIREPLQVDVGFGDALWPKPKLLKYPALLDLPAPKVAGYQPESVIAEKLEAIVTLAIRNSRIKDYFDIHYLATHETFEGNRLAEAVRRTFERRRTPIPEILPIGLDDTFWQEPERPAHVRAFARRARITTDIASARALAQTVREFLWPVLQALQKREAFVKNWPPGGPWV